MLINRVKIGSFGILGSLFLCILLLGSCVKSSLIEPNGGAPTGTPVKVSLSFAISTLKPTSSENNSESMLSKVGSNRSFIIEHGEPSVGDASVLTRATNDKPLYNLWVMQFGADKNLVKATKMSNTPEPVKEMITIDADLIVGTNQTIYLVALGPKYDNIDLSAVANIAELENFPLQSIVYVDGTPQSVIQSDEDVPYMGFSENLDIVQIEAGGRGYVKYNSVSGFTGGISMYAMVSKITFNLSYDVSDFTPSMMTINNVATNFCINPSDDYKPTSFVSLPPVIFQKEDFTGGKRQEAVWYVAPNRQGVQSAITSQEMRYYYQLAGVSEGLAPENGTYINLWASDAVVPERYALYYIFLGSNTTDDFNINPRFNYVMRSDINVAPSENDKRVIYSTIKQNIDFNVSKIITVNPQFSVKGNAKYNFDASPGRRPIEVSTLRGTLKVEILASESDLLPVPLVDSWMQISTSPNYTEALKRKESGDPDGLTTSITIKNDIPGMVKLYLYNDEKLDYTTYNPRSETLENTIKRKGFIRFTFSNENQPSESYIYQMTQNCAYYVGQFGGTRDVNTGVYSDGLVIGEKFNYCGEEYLSYHKAITGDPVDQVKILMGGLYPDIRNYSEIIDIFKADNLINGKEITRLYSENPKGYQTIKKNASTFIQAPRKVNNKLDLYQYQGKYNSGEGFAARWCYDKNRDSNHNGEIDDDEMVWYLPARDQLLGFTLNYYIDNYASITKDMVSYYLLSSTFYKINDSYWFKVYAPDVLSRDLLSGYYEVRCVRDIPMSAVKHGYNNDHTGPRVEVQDGYAVIYASGLGPRTYASKKPGSEYIRTDGRNVRHIGTKYNVPTISSISSARFRVAPTDIDVSGNVTTTAQMTWAEASGFNMAANALELTLEAQAAETGCAMYKGKNNDPAELGKWRLPVINEVILIDMLENTLASTSSTTGFQKLSFSLASVNTTTYWTATESNSDNAWGFRNAVTVTSGAVETNRRYLVNILKTSPQAGRVRCIQDL